VDSTGNLDLNNRMLLPRPDSKAAKHPPVAAGAAAEPGAILAGLAFPVIVVRDDDVILYVNAAAEQFFGHSATLLEGTRLTDLLPADNPIVSLMQQFRSTGAGILEHDVTVTMPRRGPLAVTIQVTPYGESSRVAVLALQEQSLARRLDRQLNHRDAARSVGALAALLAHEIKNPLSGIRGAAQLIEQSAGIDERSLTRLICAETDRIVALIDRMSVFTDPRPFERESVNIHEVLERVRRLAEAGFGRHLRFVEVYDPSLPPVFGNKDQLIQVFLNLIKNAAEAVQTSGGEVVLRTTFQHGVRLTVPGGSRRVLVPLEVSVHDNGPGIPHDVAAHLFEPFITTKPKGTGLGLPLVAKLVADHGGTIDFETGPAGTVFRVRLPLVDRQLNRNRDGVGP
jgi:two-component system nitrogen regulation sensor histidine kinase GlnL